MNKALNFVLFIVFAFVFTAEALTANETAGTSQAKSAIINLKKESEQKPISPTGAMKSNFIMLSGAILNIDMTDPGKVKIEVKNDRDNQIHTVEVTPATNITKVTDISELKVGELVRVMAKKADDKEIAMGVMFGKLKKLPAPPKLSLEQAAPALKTPTPAVKSKPKK
jgi:recombinational DNA repair protein RecR